ncbi:hypothetical protein GE09DRAFT_279773 [Coniochaeta sp. 2T2.1]|nr:hypothetical protein GE09DRAFT_279773 [Coniochaeta sp. 2T2.1]
MSDPLDSFFGSQPLRQEALKAISDAIDPAAHDGLMEIDVLGPALFPPGQFVMRDGSAVAVNKKGLMAAYYEVLRDVEEGRLTDGTDQASYDRASVVEGLKSLAVLTLMQPEFLLAVNMRKSLLWPKNNTPKPHGLMHLEQRFIDSLLTSPLNKHTKSPTLWSHRRWVVLLVYRYGFSDVLDDMRVVFVAAEKHPRNYYAWNHARFLMNLVDWSSENREQHVRILNNVLDWCKRHHDDTSGWSFLQGLLLAERRLKEADAVYVLQDVLKLARSLRWTNESVWVFLRTIAASRLIAEQDYKDFLQTLLAMEASTEDEAATKVLHAAAAWCENYRETWQFKQRPFS